MEEQKLVDMFNKGLEAYRRGDIKQAIDLLTRVVETNETEHKAWNALGVAFAKAGKYEDADVCFENAVMLDPDNEIYSKNRDKNAGHLSRDKKKNLDEIIEIFKGYYLNVNKTYLFLGISAIVLLLIAVFVIIPFLNPSPMAETVGEIPININVEGDQVIIKYYGPAIPQLSAFNLTSDNRSIISPNGVTKILGTGEGSAMSIPLLELRPYSKDNATTIRISAIFTDGSTRNIITEKISIPPPVIEETPKPTPTPVPYNPRYKAGDLLITKDNGSYLLVTDILPEDNYGIIPMTRRYDGLFWAENLTPLKKAMQEIDITASDSGLVLTDSNYTSDSFYQAGRKQNAATVKAVPLFSAGDLINSNQNAQTDAVIILGYDSVTEEYATDKIYRYYNGDWGYRKSKLMTWEPRSDIESRYPLRIDHVALSSVGIGEDSSPPGSSSMYHTGDIIAEDSGADAKQIIILSYNENTNKYETDTIKQSTNGLWYRSGNSTVYARSVVEREYPHKVRTLDLDLVKNINKE